MVNVIPINFKEFSYQYSIMRKELAKKLENTSYKDRFKYTGIFSKFGTKNGYKHTEGTVLLLDIKDENNNLMTDHLWFNLTKSFIKLYHSKELFVGSIIEFWGRIDTYAKGYYKEDYDYKLCYPTKLRIIGFDEKYPKDIKYDPPYIWEEELVKLKQKSIENSIKIHEKKIIENNSEQLTQIKKKQNQILLDLFFN